MLLVGSTVALEYGREGFGEWGINQFGDAGILKV